MTHDEVRNELLKDLENVRRWEAHREREHRRKSFKMRSFPKLMFTEYVSPRRNTWLVSTKYFGKDKFSSTYGVLQIQNGLVLHQIFHNKYEGYEPCICTFIPHFFERYAEYNKIDLKGKALIKRTLQDDCSFNIDKTNEISGRKDRDKENNVHACMAHGIGMGYEVDHRHYLIKTYITYEMSFGQQKKVLQSVRDELRKGIKEQNTIPIIGDVKNLLDESIINKIKRKLGIITNT